MTHTVEVLQLAWHMVDGEQRMYPIECFPETSVWMRRKEPKKWTLEVSLALGRS